MKKIKCSVKNCNTTIFTINGKEVEFTEEYRTHTIELSNGTLMEVGVCKDHKVGLVSGKYVQDIADMILDYHKDYWNQEGRGPKNWNDLEVVDPNTSKDKFLKKKQLKIKEEQLKLKIQKENEKKKKG